MNVSCSIELVGSLLNEECGHVNPLPNGLHVILHEDHSVPVVTVNVWYHVGSSRERAGRTGFAHLFEHLMFQGSENVPGDFFAPLRDVGATDFNGTTNFDRTNYFETVPKPALERALFLESDRMGWLLGAIDQGLLDEQRGVVQNEKRQGDNRPYGLVFYTLLEELLIVSIIILVFLWHVPSAIIPIITIPVAVLISFIPMRLMGVSSKKTTSKKVDGGQTFVFTPPALIRILQDHQPLFREVKIIDSPVAGRKIALCRR